jgi:hypothetical protein
MKKSERILAKVEADAAAFAINGETPYAYKCGLLTGHIRMLCEEIEPRKAGPREYTTTYATEGGEYVVYFDASEGSTGSRVEPPSPPELDINAVFANGFDVFDDLSEKVLNRIMDRCWEALEEMAAESEEYAAISRYESRRAA